MKKLTVILMILFVGILLAGCTSQTTPAATPAPTAEPTAVPTTVATAVPTTAATEVPTAEPTTATPTPTPTPIPDQKIDIQNTLTFSPCIVTIPAGTKVIWSTTATGYQFKVNAQSAGMNINSDIITPGHPWSYTFNKPGTYVMQELIYPQFRDGDCKIVVT